MKYFCLFCRMCIIPPVMKTLFISISLILVPLSSYAENCHFDQDGFPQQNEDIPVCATGSLYAGCKTNVLFWAATVMNVDGEIFFHPHISASLGMTWCPWFVSRKFSLRNLSILPEAKWWFKEDKTGHFLGVHLTVSWYNVRWDDFRYQDTSRPLLGGGLTYGYHFSLGQGWGVELSAGVGYVNTRYDRFLNVDNGPQVDLRETSWFGIDRAAISISYRFPL